MEERAWGGVVVVVYEMLVLGLPQRWPPPCCAEEKNSPKRANGCPVPHGSRGGAGGRCRTGGSLKGGAGKGLAGERREEGQRAARRVGRRPSVMADPHLC